MIKRFSLLLLALLVGLSVPGQARAQSADGIQDIRVEGAQRVDASTVLSYMVVRKGDSFDPLLIDESLKRLFATELFSDIRIRRERNDLVVMVQENPIINRIAFEGNRRIDDNVLGSEVQLRPRYVFTARKVSDDVKRILEIYRRSGRFAASVEPKIIQLEQNRVDLVFEINEGELSKVRRITFIGNKAFSDSELRSEIQTKEEAFYRVFSTTDTYDPDRLNFDRELLRRFYLKNGYADFEVQSAVAELDPQSKGFFITVTVNEGRRYRVGEVAINSTLKDLQPEDLRRLITFAGGDYYNAEKLEGSVDAIVDELGNLGYAFVEVTPKIDRRPEQQILDITFNLREGPKVFVERIDIEGNVRTLDKVIRREIDLAEGDAFNTSKVGRSRRNLNNLGFFERVQVETEPGSEPDRTVIKTRVAEKSTGELSFGVGFSTNENALANVRIRERNLLGRGQDLRLGATASARRTEFDLGFTEPYFLDRPLSAGFDLFRVTLEEASDIAFEQRRVGGAVRLGYRINNDLYQQLKYTYEDVSIENVAADASRFIKDQEGQFKTSEISQALIYDTRDNRFTPREGVFGRLGLALAGLGGDVNYYKLTTDAAYYKPVIWEDLILKLEAHAGMIKGWNGDNVNIADRFFIGNNYIRGFELAGIGPRDLTTDDALGGNIFYSGTVEFIFPLGLPEELGVRGSIFSDFGTLYNLDESGAGLVDKNSLRASVGFGVGWSSPFGPIRLDIAEAVASEDYDARQVFKFSFGTQF